MITEFDDVDWLLLDSDRFVHSSPGPYTMLHDLSVLVGVCSSKVQCTDEESRSNSTLTS
jgi:hypothetical protein